MVNRVLEVKRLKLKKWRRLNRRPKFQSAGMDAQDKSVAFSTFNYHGRTQGMSYLQEVPVTDRQGSYNPQEDIDPTTLKDYPERWRKVPKGFNPSPRAMAIYAQQKEKQEEFWKKERIFVREVLYRVWAGERTGWGVQSLHKLEILVVGDYSLVLYFSGPEWVFVQQTKDRRWISTAYRDSDEAMLAHRNKTIRWIDEQVLPTE